MYFEHDRNLPWLLLWRGVMALCALHLVIDRQLGVSLIFPLAVISMLTMLGELVYQRMRYVAEETIRKQMEREIRERRAEEARLRLEAVRQAEQENERLGMTFGLDDDPEPANEVVVGAVSTMTAEDFEVALMRSELTDDEVKKGFAKC